MITNTVSKVTYTGDGTTKQFQVTFPFIATTDLQLFLRTISTGEYEEIDSNWSYDEGYVTYPVTGSAIADTKQIVIQRNTPLTQEKDHDVRLFTSEDVEGMTDKLTQITQELRRDIEEVSSTESIDIDIASAIGRHNVHPQAHYDLFANKVDKTGSTMTGNLAMSNGNKVILSNTANNSYNVFAHETSGGVKQLHFTDTTTGTGVLLDAANSNKPFYVDGSDAYRLLDTSDKTTLETSIAGKADKDLSNLTSGLSNTICTTAATTTSTASAATPAVVVENYINGTSWYRVWSDGWCGQGGRIANVTETVTLLKEMADTNGTVTVTVNNTTAPSATSGNPCGGFISTTQIFVSASQGNLPAFWKVEGYIATGD